MMVLYFVNFEHSTLRDLPIAMFLPDTNRKKKYTYPVDLSPFCASL